MKKFPQKILILSESGFEKFKEDAEKYFAANGITCNIKQPVKFPCVAVSTRYEYEEYGKFITKYKFINIVYVYTHDFK